MLSSYGVQYLYDYGQGRLCAALTCDYWWRVFWNKSVWSHMVVSGETMCQWKYCIVKKDYEVMDWNPLNPVLP